MENTPLELYETAYRLHYVENRLPEAISYYEALIKEFPDSNECGYAAIQIQKIKSNDLAKALKIRSRTLHPAAVIALILSIFSILGILSGGIVYLYKLKIDHQRQSLTGRALSKMYAGDYDEALKLLAQVKILAKEDITPFDMSATIYRKKGQINQAKAEYDVFYQLNPDVPKVDIVLTPLTDTTPASVPQTIPSSDNESITNENTQHAQPAAVIPPPPNLTQKPVQPQKTTAPKRKASTTLPVLPSKIKPDVKAPRLVNQDSISYF